MNIYNSFACIIKYNNYYMYGSAELCMKIVFLTVGKETGFVYTQ